MLHVQGGRVVDFLFHSGEGCGLPGVPGFCQLGLLVAREQVAAAWPGVAVGFA